MSSENATLQVIDQWEDFWQPQISHPERLVQKPKNQCLARKPAKIKPMDFIYRRSRSTMGTQTYNSIKVYRPHKLLVCFFQKTVQFSSVAQSCLTLCDPMNRSTLGPPSITNSRSSLKLMSIESVMPSSHLILCHPLLLLPPIPPSIRVFSNESTLDMRWPKNWSFSFSIIPSREIPGLISFRMDWLDLLAVQGTLIQHRASLVFQTIRESASNAGKPGLIPGSGRSPEEKNGYPLQYSWLENPMVRGAWWTTVHRVTKSWT